MNKVLLIGRLVQNPEIRYSQEGMCIASFTLAVDRRIKKDGQPTADFIRCTAFGKGGEFAEKYLKKGTKIALEGHWQTGSYKNQEGVMVYTNDCIIDRLEFAESKKSEQTTQTTDDGFINIPEGADLDELPFS